MANVGLQGVVGKTGTFRSSLSVVVVNRFFGTVITLQYPRSECPYIWNFVCFLGKKPLGIAQYSTTAVQKWRYVINSVPSNVMNIVEVHLPGKEICNNKKK